MAGQKYYVVWVGRRPGVYSSWAECAAQVNGFSGAKFKAFDQADQARTALALGWEQFVGRRPRGELPPEVIGDSIAVDAPCDGSPGRLEYRGVRTASGAELFHVGPIETGTNNLGEFLAIVHALAPKYRVTTVDLPGHGRSVDSPRDYQLPALAAMLHEVVPAQATVVGWSLGGQVTTQLELDYPGTIKVVVIREMRSVEYAK